MRLIRFILINTGFAVCLYFGLVEDVNGAINVALFIAWFHVFVGIMCVSETVAVEIRKNKRTVPFEFDITYDLLVTLAFLWHGYWVVGVLYLLASLLVEGARTRELRVKTNLTES